jgi:hypothetical protein
MSQVEELRSLAQRMRELTVDAGGGGASRVIDLARHAPPPGHRGWLDVERLLP